MSTQALSIIIVLAVLAAIAVITALAARGIARRVGATSLWRVMAPITAMVVVLTLAFLGLGMAAQVLAFPGPSSIPPFKPAPQQPDTSSAQ